MVAADIDSNARSTSSLTLSSPNRRKVGTSSCITGARRLPAGAPSTAQQRRSAATVSASYSGARGCRGRTILGVTARASALRAWLRCHPVVAHSSSRITPLAALSARLYRIAIVLVTARR